MSSIRRLPSRFIPPATAGITSRIAVGPSIPRPTIPPATAGTTSRIAVGTTIPPAAALGPYVITAVLGLSFAKNTYGITSRIAVGPPATAGITSRMSSLASFLALAFGLARFSAPTSFLCSLFASLSSFGLSAAAGTHTNHQRHVRTPAE